MKSSHKFILLILVTTIIILLYKIWHEDEIKEDPDIIVNIFPSIEIDKSTPIEDKTGHDFPAYSEPDTISQDLDEDEAFENNNSLDLDTQIEREELINVQLWQGLTNRENLYSLIMSSPDLSIIYLIKPSELFDKCYNKTRGDSYIATVNITLEDKNGNTKSSKYIQLWKTLNKKNNLPYRTMMYTKEPIDAMGTTFMRWNYAPEEGRLADQWIYLPVLRKIRRLSVRDLSDNFLGSDLTYGDVEERAIERDSYSLLKSSILPNGQHGFVVVAKPKDDGDAYSKKIYSFVKNENWSSCHTGNVRFYNQQGRLQKTQNIEWQTAGRAWLWKLMLIENVETNHNTLIELTDVDVKTNVLDTLFSERKMKDSDAWVHL